MIQHHPSETTLAAYAGGTLPEGLALVVATHLYACTTCRRVTTIIESVGGAVLDDLAPAPMAADALALVLARTERPMAREPQIARTTGLPPPLDACAFGPWRRVGFGLRWRPVTVGGRALAGLLEGMPGKALPPHEHTGLELTCVISGSFVDGDARYAAGDVAENEEGQPHCPVIEGAVPCLSFVATEGVRLRGWLGLAQRFLSE